MQKQGGAFGKAGRAWGNDTAFLLQDFLAACKVLPHPSGNPGRKKDKRIDYINALSAFDIETTSLQDIKQSFMYIWQWHFVNLETEESLTIYGRYWDEWQACIDVACLCLPENAYLVVLDHNLSYEFQFLSEYYPFDIDEVFCTDPRAILKCSMRKHLEFRCTMRHSNTSLSVYTKQWNVKHQKLSGDEFDYNKIRYPWDALTDKEMQYAFHDVIGLCEAYIAEMNYWKDTLYTVPPTSTGYVRRISKREWAKVNYLDRRAWMPPFELLRLLEDAFRGGDVHGSRFHSTPADYGRAVVNFDVGSDDRISSYPDELINHPMPLGDWYRVQTKKNKWIEREEVDKYIYKYNKAVLTRVHFRGLSLIDESWELPYISKSKCLYLENEVLDNGRVLSADYLSTTITDIDWEIICKEYKWKDVYFSDTWYCRYRYLPEFFCNVVREFFRKKTILSGYEKGSMEDIERTLMKMLLNALYGMFAEHVLRDTQYFLNDDERKKYNVNDIYVTEKEYKIMKKEYDEKRKLSKKERQNRRDQRENDTVERHNKKAMWPFSVGVWVTSAARLDLHRAAWEVRKQGGRVLYVDTDSVKYTGKVDFSALNDYYKKRSLERGAYADDRFGKRYYMGVYDHEYTAKAFAHIGAKKYIYITEPKPDAKKYSERTGYHLTVAGVNKEKGAEELVEKGWFSAWHAGTKFVKAGGTQGVYNDIAYGWITIDGHDLYIGRNVCLLPDTYTLGESQDYARILEELLVTGKIDGETLGGGEYDTLL